MITKLTTRDAITCRLFCANSSTNISVSSSPNVPRTQARTRAVAATCVHLLGDVGRGGGGGPAGVWGETDEINQSRSRQQSIILLQLLQSLRPAVNHKMKCKKQFANWKIQHLWELYLDCLSITESLIELSFNISTVNQITPGICHHTQRREQGQDWETNWDILLC